MYYLRLSLVITDLCQLSALYVKKYEDFLCLHPKGSEIFFGSNSEVFLTCEKM